MVLCVPVPVPTSHLPEPPPSQRRHPIVFVALAFVASAFLILLHVHNTTTQAHAHARAHATSAAHPPVARSDDRREEEVKKVCRRTPLFVDRERLERRRAAAQRQERPPRVSIVFVTKRPGGYDILFHSLAQQTITDHSAYELIVVDELAPYRATRVNEMADELGVNLVALVPSKPRARKNAFLKFGIYNALNTGLLFARGSIVTFVMDLGWLPSNYLERTIAFYDQRERAKSFLAYPERFYYLKRGFMPGADAFTDYHSLTVFAENQTTSFSALGDRVVAGQSRPEDLVNLKYAGNPSGYEKQPRRHVTGEWTFWELSFASCPWSAIEALNGVEEEFDYGDDCHENNIRLRSEFLGYDLWIDGSTVIENLWHKHSFEPEGDRWNRFDKDSIQDDVLFKAINAIRDGKRSVVSQGHDFNLTQWRELDCPLHV